MYGNNASSENRRKRFHAARLMLLDDLYCKYEVSIDGENDMTVRSLNDEKKRIKVDAAQ